MGGDSLHNLIKNEVVMDMNSSTFTSRLNRIRELNSTRPSFVNKDLYKLLIKEEMLVAGYERIKSKKGETTPALGKLSLDGFGVDRILKLQKSLSNESWAPSPARRIYIPKPGRVEKRPLGIQGLEEKVVQSAMTLLLEAIYEPTFSKESFGFRPGIGAHNALRKIGQNYDGMTYAVEGDIKGMYDNVNHNTLVKLLEKRISDHRFMRLVRKMLNAGYMDTDGSIVSPETGTPQGSIVSPILANIYLHELDVFMMNGKWGRKGNVKKRTPVYRDIDNKIKSIKYRLKRVLDNDNRSKLIEELKILRNKSLKTRMYCNPNDRMLYSRYANDFIIGIAGPQRLAEEIRDEIREFLCTLNLTLSESQTKITDIRKEPAYFLGYRIQIETSVKYTKVYPKGRTPFLKRVTGRLVSLEAPIEKMVARLHDKGFCDNKGFPGPKRTWSIMEDKQIVQNYNSTIRGLFGYYSGAQRRQKLQRIWYILSYSCAYTLAHKHRRSLSKIFSKHGQSIKVHYGLKGEKEVSLFKPSLLEKDRKWQIGNLLPNPYA